jgi:hypothetical protein
MKTIKEIAQAHNLSPNSVKKWSTEKRERATKLIDMQINPIVMQLVGELHALCFATSNMSVKLVVSTHTEKGYGFFVVTALYGKDNEPQHFIEPTNMTVESLKSAIAKLEEVVYA